MCLWSGLLRRRRTDSGWYLASVGERQILVCAGGWGFFSWAKAHASGMDVEITDPDVFVSQVQGPNSMKVLEAAGKPFGMEIFGLDAMNIRRIEAGILNAGSDFNLSTTPYDVGLGRFVDEDKGDFIGKSALQSAVKQTRFFGIKCMEGEPVISGTVEVDGKRAGTVTAGATSPYLKHGIGYVLMDSHQHQGCSTLIT